MSDQKDVVSDDLYAELAQALKSDEAEKEETPGASPETPPAPAEPEDENKELSEEDISKLTPRAQKRIREQADEIKRLAELAQPKPPADEPDSHTFKDVKEFLEAVEDEPSRKLLEKFYGVIKAENSAVLAPFEKANAETKFEQEFNKYETIEGLADHKDDLRKTFLRNPNQSLKALISETALDLQMNKVKPVESTPSAPNRGKVDLEGKSTDELYDLLDTMRG